MFWAVLGVVWAGLDNWMAAVADMVIVVILIAYPYLRARTYRQGFSAGYQRGELGRPSDEREQESWRCGCGINRAPVCPICGATRVGSAP